MAFLFYFQYMNSICVNGKIIPADEPALLTSNRSYRYGDGLFETMKIINGKIILASFHYERFFGGLKILKFEVPKLFTIEKLQREILHLCKRNECETMARVRLSAFRDNGGLYDEVSSLQYVIECLPTNESVNKLNENGLVVDAYTEMRKSCDVFSNLKSANFLVYVMAALYVKENKLNDCLVLNTAGNIADTTIANVFIIKDRLIVTPALSEGCVNGVMRRYLLEKLKESGYGMQESNISIFDIENADEIFLTNAINGIRWVRQFRNKIYSNSQAAKIYDRFIKTILW
jgi:branched-chain amino acid aminotransferase